MLTDLPASKKLTTLKRFKGFFMTLPSLLPVPALVVTVRPFSTRALQRFWTST
jgi:hypothetical protein